MAKLLQYATMEKLLKNTAPDLRIGEDAKAALKEVLEQHAKKIGERAATLAKHAGRKTIKGEDIQLAVKE